MLLHITRIWDLKEAARLRQEEATDWAEVRTLYEESVDCGSPEGCWELALLKESGKGTAVDQEGADGLIRRAAEKGFGPACTRMGLEEARAGHGEAAFAWYQKGAAANDPQACLQAGLCREGGEGCAKDLEKPGNCWAEHGEVVWMRPGNPWSRWTLSWATDSRERAAMGKPWPATKRQRKVKMPKPC